MRGITVPWLVKLYQKGNSSCHGSCFPPELKIRGGAGGCWWRGTTEMAGLRRRAAGRGWRLALGHMAEVTSGDLQGGAEDMAGRRDRSGAGFHETPGFAVPEVCLLP
jgi:hypothetical protein